MLFYTTLFVASLISIFVLLWFFRLMASVTRKIHGTSLPHAKLGSTAHLNKKRYGKNSRGASKAWGKKPHSSPANLARTHPAKADRSASWPGNEHEIRGYHPHVATANGATPNSDLAHEKVRRLKKSPGHPNRC